jgi:hypothetical protein
VESILNTLASVRQQIPQLAKYRDAPPPSAEKTGIIPFLPGDEEGMEAFEMLTLAEALESFANELSASIDEAQEKLFSDCMEIYYAAAELIKEPEHAHLIPYVEDMRAAYWREFGRAIPPRE